MFYLHKQVLLSSLSFAIVFVNETLSHALIHTGIFFLWRAKFGEETLLVKTRP